MATKVRLTAEERGAEVLQAAVQAFAASGYEGTKTDEIARMAGVSQPYVIRLFGTKQQLFMAAVQAVCERIEQIFREAAAESPTLASLGRNYERLLVRARAAAGPAARLLRQRRTGHRRLRPRALRRHLPPGPRTHRRLPRGDPRVPRHRHAAHRHVSHAGPRPRRHQPSPGPRN